MLRKCRSGFRFALGGCIRVLSVNGTFSACATGQVVIFEPWHVWPLVEGFQILQQRSTGCNVYFRAQFDATSSDQRSRHVILMSTKYVGLQIVFLGCAAEQ